MRTRLLTLALFLTVAGTWAESRTFPRGLYGQSQSRSAILVKDFEIRDAIRGKTLEVRLTQPAGQGPFPVIVWSHGLYGSQENYKPLVEHWSSHGYLVLQATHSDSLKYKRGALSASIERPPTEDWASRPQDIKLILDSLNSHPLLKGKADPERIGIGGHSFGAHTTLLLAGAQPSTRDDFTENRAIAFLAISPQGESLLFTRRSWQGIKGPIFFVSGDNDDSPIGKREKAVWRRDAYDNSPPGNKYLYWIKDAEHSFGGIGRRMFGKKNRPEHVELVKSASLMFWDSKLRGDQKANKAFDSGALNQQASGQGIWTRR